MKLVTKCIDRHFKLIFSILIVLVIALFSVNFTLSKYSRSFSNTGTVLVAKYSLGHSESLDLGMISPGETLTYNFEVLNKENEKIADVAQDYTIKISTTNNLPLTYDLSGTNISNTGSLASNLDKETLTTLTHGSLPHTEESIHSYSLTITWPGDKIDSIYLNEVDQVSLSVEAVQID